MALVPRVGAAKTPERTQPCSNEPDHRISSLPLEGSTKDCPEGCHSAWTSVSSSGLLAGRLSMILVQLGSDVLQSHRRAVPSQDEVTSRGAVGDQEAARTAREWPVRRLTRRVSSTSTSLTRSSSLQMAARGLLPLLTALSNATQRVGKLVLVSTLRSSVGEDACVSSVAGGRWW